MGDQDRSDNESQELMNIPKLDVSQADSRMFMDKNRLLRFFEQYGVQFESFDEIKDPSYSVVKRLDVMTAAENWGFTRVNNIFRLHTSIFEWVTLSSYNYLTAINLSFLPDFENASIYSDVHKCGRGLITPFVGKFQDEGMVRALQTCRCLEKLSLCACLVPITFQNDVFANIFKVNKKLLQIRLMGYTLKRPSLLSIHNRGEMSSLFLVHCGINRKYLLRSLKRMNKLNVLSLKGSMISEVQVYSPMKLRIAKIVKRMRLDWFECLNNYLPIYLFDKQKMNNLSILCVDYATDSIDDHALKYIADNCRGLRVLSMKECHHATGKGFVPIFRLPRLRYIDVSFTNVTDEALQQNISRDLRVIICHMCRFTSDGLTTMLKQLDKFKVIDAVECRKVDNNFVTYLLTYSNDSIDRLVTARLASTGIDMDYVCIQKPLPNLRLLTEVNEIFEVDYRDYL